MRIAADGSAGPQVCASPAISILITVRDGERHLDEALASLAGQAFQDFEIIVVDDGSLDRTGAMLAAWAVREPRLRVFPRGRRGLASSLNFAASMARAPLLARLDADDRAEPERLSALYREMQRRPSVGLLGSSVDLIDEDGKHVGELLAPVTHSALVEVLREGCCLVQSSVIMRRDAFNRAGGYRSGLNLGEDFDLWSRMAEVTEIAALPEKLVRYRVHRQSTTARWPIRGALCAFCVVAAQEARRRGAAEPFVAGVPKLRAALTLAGRSRQSFRGQVWASLLSQRLLRAFVALPLPGAVKVGIRRAALRLGLRPIYRRCLSWLAGRLSTVRGGA